MPFVASRILETFLSAKNAYSILLNVCLEGFTLSIQGLVRNNTSEYCIGVLSSLNLWNEILRCELSNETTLAVSFHGALISVILPHFMKPKLRLFVEL